jgi:uncharacterized protein (TIGR04255 family)
MPNLPDYNKPPVVEVAISMQFAPMRDFTVAHVGSYWDAIRERFASVQEHAPIAHMTEVDDMRPITGSRIDICNQPDWPRTWFNDLVTGRVIQLQRDRFVYNWRKRGPEDEYPRFPIVRDEFIEHWDGFCKFLSKNRLPPPVIDQCELTYVNLICQGKGGSNVPDLRTDFTTFRWEPREGFLPDPERMSWQMTFRMPDNQGRLHIQAVPVFVPPENKLATRLSLTVRGMPQGEWEPPVMLKWFETARQWIVLGFVDVVSSEADELWEREK